MGTNIEDEAKYKPSHRTPVQRAFYESLLFTNRWSVTRLYAQNMTASQNFRTELRDMGYKRKTSLKQIDQEMDMMRRELGQFHVDREELLYLPTKQEDEILSDVSEHLPVLESIEKGGRKVNFRSRR